MAFSKYLTSSAPDLVPRLPSQLFGLSLNWPLLFGLVITWLAAAVHLAGLRFGSIYHNAWTALKVAVIVVFIVAGFAIGDSQSILFAPSFGDLAYVGAAPFAISHVFVTYSY